MVWAIGIGFVVVIGGGIALLPWARRFDRRRALERGPRRHLILARLLFFGVVLVLVAAWIILTFVK
jgi:uncharacterized membrane protein YidH (DUF202 family)